jgi:hypothetical protein
MSICALVSGPGMLFLRISRIKFLTVSLFRPIFLEKFFKFAFYKLKSGHAQL